MYSDDGLFILGRFALSSINKEQIKEVIYGIFYFFD